MAKDEGAAMAVLAVFSDWTYSGLFLLLLASGLGELSLEALSRLARGILICSMRLACMYNDYKGCRILWQFIIKSSDNIWH
jgi:hypothetical protein